MTLEQCEKRNEAILINAVEWAHGRGTVLVQIDVAVLGEILNVTIPKEFYKFVRSEKPNHCTATGAFKKILKTLETLKKKIIAYENGKERRESMSGAKLTREEITAGLYSYYLHIGTERKRLYRASGYFYARINNNRTPIYFNQYLFPQFYSIPMRRGVNDYGAECWEMEHEYRQTPGGASAPYEIVK